MDHSPIKPTSNNQNLQPVKGDVSRELVEAVDMTEIVSDACLMRANNKNGIRQLNQKTDNKNLIGKDLSKSSVKRVSFDKQVTPVAHKVFAQIAKSTHKKH